MTSTRRLPGSSEKAETVPPRAPAKQPAKPRRGKDFGAEGTNKTEAAPKPGAPPEDLGIAPHIEKSPYTRG